MSKKVYKYRESVLRLFGLLPIVVSFLTFLMVMSANSFAQNSNPFFIAQSEIDLYAALEDDKQNNSTIFKKSLDFSSPKHSPADPENSEEDSEEENEEDNKDDDNYISFDLKLLCENHLYKQQYNENLHTTYQKTLLPLYILFHSWKSHLI